MKKSEFLLMSVALFLASCGQAPQSEVSDIGFPNAPVVYTFEKADQFRLPNHVNWAYAFNNENPTFNMAIFCGANQGHCLNNYIDGGRVVLETGDPIVTADPAQVELKIRFSGWAYKYAAYEKEFMWQSFFSARLIYKTKNAKGDLEDHAQEFVLPLNALGSPTVTPWQGNEKSIYYSNGKALDFFNATTRIPAEAEDIRVQLYNLGASILQVQKIEVKVTLE